MPRNRILNGRCESVFAGPGGKVVEIYRIGNKNQNNNMQTESTKKQEAHLLMGAGVNSLEDLELKQANPGKYVLKVLKNGYESGLCSVAKQGDVGHDLIAASFSVIFNDGSELDGELLPQYQGFAFSNIKYIEYNSKVCFQPIGAFFAHVFPRSSACNYNLSMCNSAATLDSGYIGEIKLRFKYNFDPEDLVIHDNKILGKINMDKIYKPGEKIGQVIFCDAILPKVVVCESLNLTSRNNTGFGSSDFISK